MNVDEYQHKIVETIKAYGRPPTPAAHMKKLGEEIGELAEAVGIGNQSHIIKECVDVINVATSLLDQAGGVLDVQLKNKIAELNQRMQEDRFDKHFGKPPTCDKA